MKIIKGIAIFALFTMLFTSCFDPPEYSNSPKIDFENVVFVETPSISDPDSLILYINFRDGDGDLGLSQSAIDSPFHEINYFLTGSSVPVATKVRYSDLPPFVNPKSGSTGKLETIRSKGGAFNCTTFIFDSIYVSEEHKSIFDETFNIYDTLTSNSGNPNVYVLLDTFYYEVNAPHYNIEVTFMVSEPTNPDADSDGFVVFDWREEFCSTFDGRFPILSEKDGPLEGVLKYSMTSTGFKALFSIKTLRFRIKIRDRALNESSVIYTPKFTLNDIRKG